MDKHLIEKHGWTAEEVNDLVGDEKSLKLWHEREHRVKPHEHLAEPVQVG